MHGCVHDCGRSVTSSMSISESIPKPHGRDLNICSTELGVSAKPTSSKMKL